MKKEKLKHSVLKIIDGDWPISVTGVRERLHGTVHGDATLQRIKYHFDKLKTEGKIKTKKIGGSSVAWPFEIEKLRVVHELLKVE